VTRGPIVVLTNERDLAADDIIRRIDACGGTVERFNAEALSAGTAPAWTPDCGSVMEAGVVWWRQFELASDEDQPPGDLDELLVLRAQWRAWVSTLHRPGTPWVNDLWAARRAENKVVQLQAAIEQGFKVPATLVTNDPADARAFAAGRTAVVKTLAAAYFELTGQGFVYTHALDDSLLDNAVAWYRQPLIVQERIVGADIRVVVVGEKCFGARCLTEALDWRTAGQDAEWREWSVPGPVAERCRRYVSSMGLRYAAFDFVDDGSDVWFLEANQAGEWTFLDRPLGLGIGEAIAAMLLHLSA